MPQHTPIKMPARKIITAMKMAPLRVSQIYVLGLLIAVPHWVGAAHQALSCAVGQAGIPLSPQQARPLYYIAAIEALRPRPG